MARARRSTASPLDEVHTTVAERLGRAGLRYTSSRRRVVEVLAATDRPLTIPDILERDRSLAQSSTYRNLAELIAAGVVHRIVAGDEHGHYELSEDLTHHHHHLVCSRCGRVEDFSPSDDLEAALHDALARAAAAAGFSMERHRLDVVGTCPACE
jgi:Fe2+ or Zn2+ uptake regulation protein